MKQLVMKQLVTSTFLDTQFSLNLFSIFSIVWSNVVTMKQDGIERANDLFLFFFFSLPILSLFPLVSKVWRERIVWQLVLNGSSVTWNSLLRRNVTTFKEDNQHTNFDTFLFFFFLLSFTNFFFTQVFSLWCLLSSSSYSFLCFSSPLLP